MCKIVHFFLWKPWQKFKTASKDYMVTQNTYHPPDLLTKLGQSLILFWKLQHLLLHIPYGQGKIHHYCCTWIIQLHFNKDLGWNNKKSAATYVSNTLQYWKNLNNLLGGMIINNVAEGGFSLIWCKHNKLVYMSACIWATMYLPLPWPNINLQLLSVDCCWVWGGVVEQSLTYWCWYTNYNITLINW